MKDFSEPDVVIYHGNCSDGYASKFICQKKWGNTPVYIAKGHTKNLDVKDIDFEYKGKNIVYSLGNFCFGGNKNPSDKDTMIFQQTFTVENGKLAEDDVTNIIPCSLSSESGYNNYQPMVLEGSEKERVLQKIEDFSTAINQ